MIRRKAFSTILPTLTVLGLIALAGGIARAQHTEQWLTASDAASNAEFGIVAVDNRTILVGAPADDDIGAVYVYVRCRGEWIERQKLTASDAQKDDRFGTAVAIDGDTLAVSAVEPNLFRSAVYVFTRDAAGIWTQKQKLTAADQVADDAFGVSIALSGDTLLVGSPKDDVAKLADFGSAYVFTRDTTGNWSQTAHLTAWNGAAGDHFGWSVALSGDTVIVGAHLADKDQDNPDAGAAYVFVRDEKGFWTREEKLTAKAATKEDYFGISVSVDGDTALVGAIGVEVEFMDMDNNGAAYVYTRKGGAWTEEARLDYNGLGDDALMGCSVAVVGDLAFVGAYGFGGTQGLVLKYRRSRGAWDTYSNFRPSDGKGDDWFGYSLAFDGATAVVAASRDDFDGLTDAGSVRVYSYEKRITASDASLKDEFGVVAVDGDTLVVGAPYDDDTAGDSGAVYAFLRAEDGTWEEKQKLKASGAASGDALGYVLALNGDTFVAASPAGYVCVFTRDASGKWSEQQKLTASDGAPIGSSIDLEGDTLVVGARGGDVNGVTDCGSAFVFVRDPATGKWSEQARLAAEDGAESDQLGRSTALSGNTVVIGAHLADRDKDNPDAGAAYVFVRDTGGNWTQQAKLTAKDAGAYDAFGIAVALDGDTALVGATGADIAVLYGTHSDAGAAYVFTRKGSEWTEQAKVAAPDPFTNARFGCSGALVGDVAVVGSFYLGGGMGRAHVFDREGTVWKDRRTLGPWYLTVDYWFGHTVAFDGFTAVIGAIRDDGDGMQNAGAAYVYEHVNPGPEFEILPFSFPTSTSGLSFQGQPEVVGGTPPRSWDVKSGTLPVPGGIDAETGAIDGIWGTPGQYDFTLRVRAICGHEATEDFSVTVNPWPAITTTSFSEGTMGRPYAIALAGTGGTTPNTWTVTSGDLPVSGTLDPVTGGLSGDALAPGVYSFAVRLTDSLGAFIDDSYTVTINDVPKIATASLPEWTTGRPYQILIEGIDGTQPNTWTVSSGSMPIGGTLDPAAGSLSGDARDPDDYLFTVRLTDAMGAVAEKACKVKINEWPSITSPPESVSICNRPFECGLVVADGTAPLTWSVVEGELPAGFALDPATGVISGTTTEASGYEFKLRVTDHAGAVAEKDFMVDAVPLADLAGKKHVEDIEGNIFDRPTPVCTALELVEGTKLNVSVKLRGSGSLPLALKLLDAAGNHVGLGTALRVKSKSLALKGLLVPATGRYYLVLEKTSSFTAGVRVTIKVTAPRKASGFDAVTPGSTFDVTCGTLKGARVSIKVKAAKGSPALPTILSVRNEAGDELLEPAELKLKKNSAVLNMKAPVAGGDLTIRIGARDGTGGEIVWSAKIQEPKGYVYSRPGATAGFER